MINISQSYRHELGVLFCLTHTVHTYDIYRVLRSRMIQKHWMMIWWHCTL